MEHHVGVDASLELSGVCVLDATGKVIREAKVASEPEALVAFLRGLNLTIARVGLEAASLSQWLYDGLHEAGLEPVLLETRHVKAALSATAVKTDRRDARGIAAHGLVSCRPPQVASLAGGPGASGCAQAAADQGHRSGEDRTGAAEGEGGAGP